jgi:hypothetical protein
MIVDSPTPMFCDASEIDMCITRSGFPRTNAAMERSAGFNASNALLIRMRQPAFGTADCFARIFITL